MTSHFYCLRLTRVVYKMEHALANVCLLLFLQSAVALKYLPNNDDFQDMLRDGHDYELWVVGTYLAAFKYFGLDYRYTSGESASEEVGYFYKKFPSPILKEFDEGVVKACSTRAIDCIPHIFKYAKQSATMQHLMRRGLKLEDRGTDEILKYYHPFANSYEMFRFRQTAMHYLCWLTLLEDKYLHYQNPYVGCLQYFFFVDEISRVKRKKFLLAGKEKMEFPRIIYDRRDVLNRHYADPLTCPKLWFCPDPCFGRKSGGNFDKYKLKNDMGNPCRHLKNPMCDWTKENGDFEDLRRNRFNITCDCESDKKGFHWNSRFGLCVDTDECYEHKDNCRENRVCRNSPGGFLCVCPRGFEASDDISDCQKIGGLYSGALILNVKEGLGPSSLNENDLIDDIMEIFGLTSASFLTHLNETLFGLIVFRHLFL